VPACNHLRSRLCGVADEMAEILGEAMTIDIDSLDEDLKVGRSLQNRWRVELSIQNRISIGGPNGYGVLGNVEARPFH
jgi:hypothetical protein